MEAAIDAGRPIYAIARSMAQEPAFDLRGASPVLANLEGWADFGKLDPKAKMAALRNPEQRARLAASLRQHPQFGAVYVKASASDASRPFSGRKLADIARQRGADAADLLLDVAAGDNLETWFGIATDPGEQEEVIEPILKSKAVIVGISDAGAHVVRVRSDFPSWFLSHWVRDKGAFTLEEGVRQLTSVPAGVFRLQDRGRLEPGCAADVTLFDPATIAPGPLEMRHDLPANGRRVYNQSAGIPWVLVNGEPVVEQGALTSARAGELLA
jgi:N-acyl-D-aspartate/D-glutamate deacylase